MRWLHDWIWYMDIVKKLVCGDHVEGGLRKVWFEFMSSIIHHLIGGGFSVLIDSYCSSWSCFWYVCMFFFSYSQRWIKGWRGLVSVHGWFDSLQSTVIFIWSDLLECGVELLINLELRDCLDDIIPSRFSFFICTVQFSPSCHQSESYISCVYPA